MSERKGSFFLHFEFVTSGFGYSGAEGQEYHQCPPTEVSRRPILSKRPHFSLCQDYDSDNTWWRTMACICIFNNYWLSTLVEKSGAIISCADMGTEEGNGFIAMQGNGETDAERMLKGFGTYIFKGKWRMEGMPKSEDRLNGLYKKNETNF